MIAFAAGCGPAGEGPPAAAPVDAAVSSPERPPRGQAALEAWLAEGFHRSWRCEEGISSMRLTGNHGRHRICSNELLLGSTSGDYPVGAASVKELYVAPGDRPNGYAVGLKVEPGDGAQTWYWYERRGSSAPADHCTAKIRSSRSSYAPGLQGLAVPL